MSLIDVRNVRKSYGSKEVLKGVSLQVKNRYILNKIYNGKQIFFSRFIKLFHEINENEDYHAYVEKVFGKNTVEIKECFGFNANVHNPVAKKRIVLPLTDIDETTAEEIRLENCYFQYSQKEKIVKVFHRTMGEIEIVYLGSLAYNLLPIMMRALLGLKPSTRFDPSYLNFWDKDKECGLIVDRIPEITYDNMVLLRKQYLLHSIFDYSKPEEDVFIDLVREFRRCNLPMKFFVKSYTNGNGFDYYNMGRTQLKPQYIDLSNLLLCREFLSKLEKEKLVIIEEIAPYNEEEQYIHEYQIEYTTIN